jgi:predicted DNA-binding transcriptional regulator YafY
MGRGVRLPPLMFSAAEAIGLVMAVLDGHRDPADSTDPVGGALGKIVRALPEPVAAQVDAVRRTTSPAPDRAAARPDPGITTALVQACAGRRPVRLDYRSEGGSEWMAEVDPWSVVVRHGRWYLLCRSRTADARRAYRIDRVRSVETLDGTVGPPPDLDPVAMLEEHLAVGWEYEAEVIIEAPQRLVQHRLPRSLGRIEPAGDDATRLIGSTSNPVWYAEQLAVIPVPYRIISCAEIRCAAAALGARAVAAAQAPATDPDPAPVAGSRPAARAGRRPDEHRPAAPIRPAG